MQKVFYCSMLTKINQKLGKKEQFQMFFGHLKILNFRMKIFANKNC